MLVDTSNDNAVTPIPSWPVDDSVDEMSPVSFDPPIDLVRYGALNFSFVAEHWRGVHDKIFG